jgi:hypothetical protein
MALGCCQQRARVCQQRPKVNSSDGKQTLTSRRTLACIANVMMHFTVVPTAGPQMHISDQVILRSGDCRRVQFPRWLCIKPSTERYRRALLRSIH